MTTSAPLDRKGVPLYWCIFLHHHRLSLSVPVSLDCLPYVCARSEIPFELEFAKCMLGTGEVAASKDGGR